MIQGRIFCIRECHTDGAPPRQGRAVRRRHQLHGVVIGEMGTLKAIIFDVDGTLAETERNGHLVACNEAFAQMGFDIRWSWEEFKELLKIPGNARRMRLALSTRTSLSETDIDRIVPELFALKKELYLKRVEALPLLPGVARIIHEAIDRGIRLAIVSVTHEDQILALLRAQIPEARDAFNPIFGDRKSTRLNSSHIQKSRMPSSA